MYLVKKQGAFEVFSRGAEEPWSIWRDGRPHRQVWTWREVDEILRGDSPSPDGGPQPHATAKVVEVILARRIRSGASFGEPRYYATLVDKISGREIYRSAVRDSREEATTLAEAFAERRGLKITGRV